MLMENAHNRVIYAGDLGSFSHQATELAKKLPFLAGRTGELIYDPATSPTRVIDMLHKGEAAYGVIPFRNPLVGTGSILSTQEAFQALGVELPPAELQGDAWWKALREMHPEWEMSDPIPLCMLFHVLCAPDVKPEEIHRVVGYRIATAQCKKGMERVIGRDFVLDEGYSDSAKAAADLRELLNNPAYVSPDEEHETERLKPVEHTGVLANQMCADIYGLKVAFHGVQDNPDGNTTTFAVLRNPWHQ